MVFLHIWALHVPGNNNPTGISVKGPQDTVPFHPYYTMKDGFAIVVFLIFYALFVFYGPNYLGDAVTIKTENALYRQKMDKGVTFIDARDIARAAARVLTESGTRGKPTSFPGRKILPMRKMRRFSLKY